MGKPILGYEMVRKEYFISFQGSTQYPNFFLNFVKNLQVDPTRTKKRVKISPKRRKNKDFYNQQGAIVS